MQRDLLVGQIVGRSVAQTVDLHPRPARIPRPTLLRRPHQPDIAYTETLLGQHPIEEPSYVASIRTALDTLTTLTLTCQQSIILLERLAAHHIKANSERQPGSPERGIPPS